jgi:hypothetical protein
VKSGALVLLVLACAGCTAHRPAAYRLLTPDTGPPLLIPPGVAKPELAVQRFAFPAAPKRGACPSKPGVIVVRERKRRIVVTVRREGLAQQPTGWLSAWTAELEAQSCVAPGDGEKLAERIAESVPLELNAAFHLLHGAEVDVGPQTRIAVVSPVFREGTPAGATALETAGTTGSDSSLTVTMRASPNLIGFETAWYGLRSNASHTGFSIVPLHAERNVQGKIEPLPAPSTNTFAFPEDAAFYRLFYKADQTEFTALAVAARTRAELEQRTKILEAGTASCRKLNDGMCIAIPRGTGVNAYVAVSVNGREVAVPWPATVRAAIQQAGAKDARAIIPRLEVRKNYGGRLAPVEFDPAGHAILGLMLAGGESIAWK